MYSVNRVDAGHRPDRRKSFETVLDSITEVEDSRRSSNRSAVGNYGVIDCDLENCQGKLKLSSRPNH